LGEENLHESRKPIVAIVGYVTLGVTVLGGLFGTLMQYREFREEMETAKDEEVAEYRKQLEEKFERQLEDHTRDFKTEMATQKLAVAEANRRVVEAKQEISRDELARAEKERADAVKERERSRKLAEEAQARAAAADSKAAEQLQSARDARRTLADSHYQAAQQHIARRDHRRAVVAMRRAVLALSGLDERQTERSYRAALSTLIEESPVFRDPMPVPSGQSVVSFRYDSSQPGRRMALLTASEGTSRLGPRAFAPWRDGIHLQVNGLGLVRTCRHRQLADGCDIVSADDVEAPEVLSGADAHFAMCIATDVERGLVAIGTFDGIVALYTVDAGTPAALAVGVHRGPVLAVAFRPAHRELISAGADGVLCRWRIGMSSEEGETASAVITPTATRSAHNGFIRCLAVSGDGDRAATAGGDNAVHVWSLQDLGRQEVLSGHGSEVGSIAFHPGRALCASQSWDGTVRLWNVASDVPADTGRLIAQLEASNDSPNLCVRFSPDGMTLAALTWGRSGFAVASWTVPGVGAAPKSDSIDDRIRALGIDPEGGETEAPATALAGRKSFADILLACKKTATEGRGHLRSGRTSLAIEAALKSHECHPLNAWASGLHSEIRGGLLERLSAEMAQLRGTESAWPPVLDEWLRINSGPDAYAARLRAALVGLDRERPIRLERFAIGLVKALDDEFTNAVATGSIHQAHRMKEAHERFKKAFVTPEIASLVGPEADALVKRLDEELNKKEDLLYGFDPPVERRYGYATGANHRLEAGEATISGGYRFWAGGNFEGVGEGNMLRLQYTWRQKPPRRTRSSRFLGATVIGMDSQVLFDPINGPNKLFLGVLQVGGGFIAGRRFRRSAVWLGGEASVADVTIDDFTQTHRSTLPSIVFKLGYEHALLAARTGADVAGGFSEAFGGASEKGEGTTRMGLSLFADVDWGDWGALAEFDYLRHYRASAGFRWYPSPYFGLGFHVPFSAGKINGTMLSGDHWATDGTFVRASVLVQF
jgi:hypothetical protein